MWWTFSQNFKFLVLIVWEWMWFGYNHTICQIQCEMHFFEYIVHSQSSNNGIMKNNRKNRQDKVYFLVNPTSCHTRVFNWATREDMRQVELSLYTGFFLRILPEFPYYAVEDSGISALRTRGCATTWNFSTRNCLSTRTHQIQLKMCYVYEWSLNVDNF